MSLTSPFDAIRRQFPILSQTTENGSPLVYLDNAATTHKPGAVVKSLTNHYNKNNANVHRGAHSLGDKATLAFEQSREAVREFLNAKRTCEIIFTRGTTESINLVANSWGADNLGPGDLIVLSELEHHANIVPWQMIAARTGARIEPVRLTEDNALDMAHYQTLLAKGPKLVAFAHISNAIGGINPVAEMIAQARQAGAVTLIDGAQAVPHLAVDVAALDCDFYAFSGHKMFGPTGIGVLYGKQALLEAMPPWQGGGEMIRQVSFEQTTYNDLPYKFEAGTPNIAGTIGLASAIRYLSQFDRQQLQQHESTLFDRLYLWLSQHREIELYSPQNHNPGIVSFNVKGEHHQDIGTLLDQQGVLVRTGHHCAMPLMDRLGIKGCVRASLAFYNDQSDVDGFIAAMTKVLALLKD